LIDKWFFGVISSDYYVLRGLHLYIEITIPRVLLTTFLYRVEYLSLIASPRMLQG